MGIRLNREKGLGGGGVGRGKKVLGNGKGVGTILVWGREKFRARPIDEEKTGRVAALGGNKGGKGKGERLFWLQRL